MPEIEPDDELLEELLVYADVLLETEETLMSASPAGLAALPDPKGAEGTIADGTAGPEKSGGENAARRRAARDHADRGVG